jgi:hypothetical protein
LVHKRNCEERNRWREFEKRERSEKYSNRFKVLFGLREEEEEK